MRAKTVLIAAMLAATVGGCGKKLRILQYPEFYDGAIRTVAVLPMSNTTLRKQAGPYVTDRVTAELARNGTYAVIPAEELLARLQARDIELPALPTEAAAALRRLGGVDAFLSGTVVEFSAASYAHLDVDTDYFYAGSHGYGYGYRRGYHGTPFFRSSRYYDYSVRNVGVASIQASLVRVSDGQVLYGSVLPAGARVQSQGDPPGRTPESCLMEAADRAAKELVSRVAVSPGEVKVNPGKALRTAREKPNGEIDYTGSFRGDEKLMLIVVTLPAAADRNQFRVEIVPKVDKATAEVNPPAPLAKVAFPYEASKGRRVLELSPADIYRAAGEGKYRIRFFSEIDPAPAFTREFKIERPKGG